MKDNFTVEISDGIVNKKIIEGASYFRLFDTLTLAIKSVSGTIKLTSERISRPSGCNQNLQTGLFCMNTKNGDIYITTKANNIYLGGESFNLTIELRNQKIDQPQELLGSFVLNVAFVDSCQSTNKPYFELRQSECESYVRSINSARITEDQSGDILTLNYQRETIEQQVLGVSIARSVFNSSNGKYSLNIEAGNSQNKSLRFTVENGTSPIYVSVYPLGNNDLSQTFKFFILNENNPLRVRLTLNSGSLTVWQSTTWRQCTVDECVNTYKTWNNAQIAANNPKCKIDNRFIEPYYNRCTSKHMFSFSFFTIIFTTLVISYTTRYLKMNFCSFFKRYR